MKHLITYLIESVDNTGRFNNVAKTLDELTSNAPHLHISNNEVVLNMFQSQIRKCISKYHISIIM